MDSHIKKQLLTTKIHINSSDIYKTKNIDGLIKFNMKKQIEGFCNDNGYVFIDSLKIIKRSHGIIITQNNVSKIEFDITYEINVLLPCKDDKYDCIIESITKMGIIAYMYSNDDTINNIQKSPLLFIVPEEYIGDNDISKFIKGQKINITVVEIRIKYRSSQIQVVGKI